MKSKELQNKKPEELHTLIAEKREGLRQFRFNQGGSKVKNVREGRALRRDIARALTMLNK